MATERNVDWCEETTGLCPTCLMRVPAVLHADGGRVLLDSECARHGAARALIASDADEYLRLRTYVPPRVSAAGGCCCNEGGSCDAGPPVCVLLLEITQACNLRCPTCYADARGHDYMPLAEARARLDVFFRDRDHLDVLMLSGGEPTIHPQFEEFLALALEYPVDRVLINTNGLRIARSDSVLRAIERRRGRAELYLSFASLRPEVHQRLYGRDLRAEKTRALERAGAAGIHVTLVPTVERGYNDGEIGDLYRFALGMERVCGITYQPVMTAGRYEHDKPVSDCERLTMTDVLALLEAQTDGALRSTDFVGLPCSHPDCCALTYGLLDPDRTTLHPLPRFLDIARYLELFADRISFSGIVGSAARRVWSDLVRFRAGRTLRDLTVLFSQAGLADVLMLRGDRAAVGRRIFRVVVKPFMDAHTYDQRRVDQCCTKVLAADGVPVSFCEYNTLHRGRAVRRSDIALEPLSAAPSATTPPG